MVYMYIHVCSVYCTYTHTVTNAHVRKCFYLVGINLNTKTQTEDYDCFVYSHCTMVIVVSLCGELLCMSSLIIQNFLEQTSILSKHCQKYYWYLLLTLESNTCISFILTLMTMVVT